ncbi:MAG: hypothetical protein ACKO2K_08500 [Alphaproteobacteria bacterium]
MAVVAMLVALFGAAGAHPAAAARGPRICPLDQVGTIFAQLDAACPCGEAVSKREYRRCVRLAGRSIMKASDNTLPRNCLRAALRCGNQSTCGVGGAVLCERGKPGSCTDGACQHDMSLSCATDQDCVLSVCDVRQSPKSCQDNGGTPAGLGTCCAF